MSDFKRDALTRETSISMMMGKKEQYVIEQGATIRDLEPIFESCRLKVRTFHAFTKRLIYKYDHTCPDSHAKPLYCMIKRNRNYVLNNDLNA